MKYLFHQIANLLQKSSKLHQKNRWQACSMKLKRFQKRNCHHQSNLIPWREPSMYASFWHRNSVRTFFWEKTISTLHTERFANYLLCHLRHKHNTSLLVLRFLHQKRSQFITFLYNSFIFIILILTLFGEFFVSVPTFLNTVSFFVLYIFLNP